MIALSAWLPIASSNPMWIVTIPMSFPLVLAHGFPSEAVPHVTERSALEVSRQFEGVAACACDGHLHAQPLGDSPFQCPFQPQQFLYGYPSSKVPPNKL